jgi:hypothetical protein
VNKNGLSQINNIPKLITAHALLVDKFSIEISKNKKIELAIGAKICFVKSNQDLVSDTITRGLLPKRHGGLESSNVFVLVANNKLDFYNIVEIADKKYQMTDIVLKHTIVKRIFTIYQLAHFLIVDLEKEIKKFNSKLVIITGDFFLSDPQIVKEEKDWLYLQIIEAIKKVVDSIIVIFSPNNLPNVVNYDCNNKVK